MNSILSLTHRTLCLACNIRAFLLSGRNAGRPRFGGFLCAEPGNPSAGLKTEHSCLTPCTAGPAISDTRSTWNRQREAGVNATGTAHRGPQEEECLLDPASLLPCWALASSPLCAGQLERSCFLRRLGRCPAAWRQACWPPESSCHAVIPDCGGSPSAVAPRREAPASVWRTADCKHYLAIKRAGVGWREEVGWFLLIRPR